MGFFSQDCKGCGHSLREGRGWMSNAVALTKNGSILKGEYDGYGRVGQFDDAVGFESEVYHRACWELLGKPTEFTRRSRHSGDQGCPPADELPVPKSLEDLKAMTARAEKNIRIAAEAAKRAWAQYEAKKAQEATDGTAH